MRRRCLFVRVKNRNPLQTTRWSRGTSRAPERTEKWYGKFYHAHSYVWPENFNTKDQVKQKNTKIWEVRLPNKFEKWSNLERLNPLVGKKTLEFPTAIPNHGHAVCVKCIFCLITTLPTCMISLVHFAQQSKFLVEASIPKQETETLHIFSVRSLPLKKNNG